MTRLNVLVADDSEICRTTLRDILEADRDIRVIGEAADGTSAFRLIGQLKPNLATIDIQMPGIGGLDLIERVMAMHPLPILVVTGLPAGPGSDLVFEALRRGALDVAEKPAGERTRAAAELREQVRLLAKVSVVRHVAGLRHRTSKPAAKPLPREPSRTAVPLLAAPRPIRIVGIGASAGGPRAVASVLGALPTDFPACVALVQHIPPGFAQPLATFLRGVTRLPIEVVEKRTQPLEGVVLIASDDRHLLADSTGTFISAELPPVSGHRPSVTALLSSLAKAFAESAIGVVLTGIGNDGTAGLLEMKAAGAITIAQNEATSAVYGMPKAAAEAGAATAVLPLEQIGPEVLRLVRGIGVRGAPPKERR